MKRLFLSLGLLTLLFHSQPALAEERVLTLKEAIEAGLKDNPEIRAMSNSVGAVQEDIGIARSNLLPKITLEERFMRTTNPTFAFSSKLNQERFTQADFAIDSLNNPAAINDFQTSISFEQPLYVRKAHVGLKMAKGEYSAKLEDFSRKKEEITFNIVKTYLMVGSASEYADTARKSLDDVKEHLRLAEARYNANLGLYSDLLRAKTSLTEAEQRLISAEKNFNVAKRALGLLIGLSEPVSIDKDIPEITLKGLEHYNNASVARKDVKAMEKRSENARNNIELAKSDYYPMIGIGGGYFINDHSAPFGAEGDSWQVSAFLRWNIFDGTLRKHEASKARYKANEAEEYLNGLKKAVSFKVYESYLGVEEARKNTELSEAALKSAEEGERLVRIRYENSLSPIIDLLDAQAALDNARANYVSKKNDYRTAVANLSFESGTILQDLEITAK